MARLTKLDKLSESLGEHLIGVDVAAQRKRNYMRNQLKKLNTIFPYGETESVWFPLDVIETYVEFIKELNKKHKKIDGIRIHFASYPEAYKVSKRGRIRPKNCDYGMTVQLVPTIPSGDKRKDIHENLKHDDVFLKDEKLRKIKKEKDKIFTIKNYNIILNEGIKYPPPPQESNE